MPLATTLRLLAKARGLNATDLATAIPKAGVATVSAWLRGEKLPGMEQLDALARTLGVPAGALLAELASTFDPVRTKGEHALLAAYRGMTTRQQDALLEIAQGIAGPAASRAPDAPPSRAGFTARVRPASLRSPKARAPKARPPKAPSPGKRAPEPGPPATRSSTRRAPKARAR